MFWTWHGAPEGLLLTPPDRHSNFKGGRTQPLAIAKELGIPSFLVFDADGDTVKPEHRRKHERDNKALMALLNIAEPPFPLANVAGDDHAIWQTNLTLTVDADIGADCSTYKDAVRSYYAHEGGLEKHDLFIADWLTAAHADGKTSKTLAALCTAILKYAKNEVAA